MNAALLLMSSTVALGGWGEGPLPAVQPQGCSNCATAAPACGCCEKASFLDKIKAHFAPKPSCGCDTCGGPSSRPNLLEKLKSHHCKAPACDCCSAPIPCATPGAPVVPPTGAIPLPPKDMPKTTTPPKDMPKTTVPPKTTGSISDSPSTITPTEPASVPAPLPAVPGIPSTAAPAVPPIPTTPVVPAPSANGASPY